jgi:excisionase family DNA binding protein
MTANQTTNPEAYSIATFCAAFGIGMTKTYDLIKRGDLVARKLGTRTLILRADAEAWARSLPTMN